VAAMTGMCEGVLSLNSREREWERHQGGRGYDQDNGAGLRRTKAERMPGPCSRGRTRNATLVRYGLSFVIPLSGDCDTEDTTATNGWGETAGDLIQFAYSRLYAAPSAIFAMYANSRRGWSFATLWFAGYRPRENDTCRKMCEYWALNLAHEHCWLWPREPITRFHTTYLMFN